MSVSRRSLLKTLASAGALALPEGVFAPAIAEAKPLRIGILAPRSGIAASAGISGLRGTAWAVERFNAQGGIAGRKVELVVEEETSPKHTIERLGGMRLLHENRQIGKEQRRENQVGLCGLEGGDVAGELHGADLRPLLRDDLVRNLEALQQGDEGGHVVAA